MVAEATPPDQTSVPPDVTEIPNGGWDARVRVFRHGPLVDTAAVVTERYVVLLDTGARQENMAVVMERLGDVLPGRHLLVLNTHGDWDHYWGNRVFAGPGARYPAPVLGHVLLPGRIETEQERAYLAELRAQNPGELDQVEIISPTITFTPPLVIDGGDLRLEIIATPGHQPDHVAVWIPQIRLLWAADAAEHPWPFAIDPAALPDLRASLDRMLALNPEWALYCHAPDIASPQIIANNRAYFDALEARCRDALSVLAVGPEDAAKDADLTGLPDKIGFPAPAALAPDADPAVLASGSYARAHARNTRVMLAWLLYHQDDRAATWPAL
jgi:glyoxylase-like metal-dependent hydrolase (beta-lactamase superfamily II)